MPQMRFFARTPLADRKGAALIEFAFLAPVFFLVLLMALDFGRLGLIAATLEFAAQDGARMASIRGAASGDPASEADIATYVLARVYGTDADAVDVSVTWVPSNASGSAVTVTADHSFAFLLGLIPIGPIPLGGTSSLIIQ